MGVPVWRDQSGHGNEAVSVASKNYLRSYYGMGVSLNDTFHRGFVVADSPSLDFASGDFRSLS